MSWWRYVIKTSGTESPKVMQARTAIDGPNFSRWKAGHVPKVETVAQFARAYGRPVLEAFVAAGFLTSEEAKARPSRQPDFTQLSNQDLLDLVGSRMREDGEGHVSATNNEPPAPTPIGGRRGRRVSDRPPSVPDTKVAMDDPDLLLEREAQIEDP